MVSVALMELADMMMDQYERVTGCYDKYELQNLRDAAKAGLQEFDSVCMQIFGANFDNTLFASVKDAYDELSWNYENNSDPTAKTENDVINDLEGIDEIKNAVKIAVRLLKQHKSAHNDEAAQIAKKIRSVVVQFREKLDPTGTISPEVPDPIATPNIRNVVLEDRVYTLRIEELRTFTEIGAIVGLTASAVSRLFRRAYRDRHGISAPMPKLVSKHRIRTLVTE